MVPCIWQNVRTPADKPPDFVIHEVKDAVAIVKRNAVPWRTALNKELAAIELTKSRQSDFFTFIISLASGWTCLNRAR